MQSLTLRSACTPEYLERVDAINEEWKKEQDANRANALCASVSSMIINEEDEKYDLQANEEDEDEPDVQKNTVYNKVLDAWMDGDEAVLQKYVYGKLPDFHQELFEAYVGQRIMSESDFEEAYRDITSNYLFSF